MKKHRGYVSVYVSDSVDVPVDDVLEGIDTKDLVEELESRKASASTTGMIDSDWLDRLRWFLLHHEEAAALAMVEGALWPAQAIAARMTNEMKATVQ